MNKRKAYFRVFDPILQKDILLYLSLFWFIWLILQSLFIYGVLFTDVVETEGPLGRAHVVIIGSVLFSAGLFLAAILLFNRFLHRITGPIHRIKTDLDDFVAGKAPKPTQVRHGDYFQELSETINKAFLKKNE